MTAFHLQVRDRLERFQRTPAGQGQATPAPAASPGSGARPPALKPAAVTIALVGDSTDPAFLLTRRASHLRAHGGQWALPGGRQDPGESAAQTALRELHEEVGLFLDDASVLGTLDDYPTRSGYLITPVVVWAGITPALAPNPDEVDSVHLVPIAQIAAADAVDFTRIPQSDRPVVRIRIMNNLVHAPTAAILYQFRELLAGRITRVAELEQPLFAWR
jgi:8-oxo-dGTP pyrophosphatase MutT (NUDIX family)